MSFHYVNNNNNNDNNGGDRLFVKTPSSPISKENHNHDDGDDEDMTLQQDNDDESDEVEVAYMDDDVEPLTEDDDDDGGGNMGNDNDDDEKEDDGGGNVDVESPAEDEKSSSEYESFSEEDSDEDEEEVAPKPRSKRVRKQSARKSRAKFPSKRRRVKRRRDSDDGFADFEVEDNDDDDEDFENDDASYSDGDEDDLTVDMTSDDEAEASPSSFEPNRSSSDEDDETRVKMELVLRDYQETHFRRMLSILSTMHVAIDNSSTGRGKTMIAFAISRELQIPVLVIAPLTVISAWKKVPKEFKGIPRIAHIMGYESLRSSKSKGSLKGFHTLKHGLLRRHDEIKEPESDKGKPRRITSFELTDRFRKLVRNGVLLVFDEFHSLKNNSLQNKAASMMIRHVSDQLRHNDGSIPAKSRCILLSATPMDKLEHANNFSRLVGFITKSRLASFNPQTMRMSAQGVGEMINECMALDAEVTRSILERLGYYRYLDLALRQSNVIVYELYIKVVLPHLSSAMPPSVVPRRLYRGFFNITSNEDRTKIDQGVGALARATKFDEATGEVDMRGGTTDWSQITHALMEMEAGKIRDMCRVGVEQLNDDPKCKVILAVNYKNSIATARTVLEKRYEVLELSGDVAASSRQSVIDRFNTDDRCRVLLMTVATGGIGINLHDTQGSRKRFMYIMPDYKMINIHQATGRIFRFGAQTIGEAYLFYSNNSSVAAAILSSLARKSSILKASLYGDENKEQDLPGEYPLYVEGVGVIEADANMDLPECAKIAQDVQKQAQEESKGEIGGVDSKKIEEYEQYQRMYSFDMAPTSVVEASQLPSVQQMSINNSVANELLPPWMQNTHNSVSYSDNNMYSFGFSGGVNQAPSFSTSFNMLSNGSAFSRTDEVSGIAVKNRIVLDAVLRKTVFRGCVLDDAKLVELSEVTSTPSNVPYQAYGVLEKVELVDPGDHVWTLSDLKGYTVELLIPLRLVKRFNGIKTGSVVCIFYATIGETGLTIQQVSQLTVIGEAAQAGECIHKDAAGYRCGRLYNTSQALYCKEHARDSFPTMEPQIVTNDPSASALII